MEKLSAEQFREKYKSPLDVKFPRYIRETPEKIFIPTEVMSSKNSKRILWKRSGMSTSKVQSKTAKGSNMTPYIGKSTQALRYEKETSHMYALNKNRFKSLIKGKQFPIYVEFTFIRKTKSRWDFSNMIQLVQDMMVKHGWLEDDDTRILMPVPPLPPSKPFHIDKESAGVIIRVL